MEGIALRGEFIFDAAAKTWACTRPLELTVKTISTKRFGARNFSLSGLVDERRVFAGKMTRVEMAGGDMTIDPFTLPLNPPMVSVNVRFNRIGLQDVAALVPTGFSEARGRIDGVVQIDWSKARGLRVGSGRITLRDDEAAVVRLQATPGLLTQHMPERFELLPAWLGPLARWASPINPAYAELKAIEMGEIPLQAQSLTVELTPEGDNRGRSARVQLVGRPARAGTTVDRVTFEADVMGPLSVLMQVTANDHSSIKFGP
ncbi:MAG: YdbH domain-containing protein [Undibacterium sp.]|nr:YdbH domain-containing protein [Opitutaceae bacterium]